MFDIKPKVTVERRSEVDYKSGKFLITRQAKSYTLYIGDTYYIVTFTPQEWEQFKAVIHEVEGDELSSEH